MEWLDIFQKTLISGGVLYLLVDRFARTREQRGADSAGMVQQIASAFEKTLETVMTYSQGVIDKMRENDERDEKRHAQTEKRCEDLERKVAEIAEDNELLNSIVGEAVTCKHLKAGNNRDCPVIARNQKRLAARCRANCKSSTEKELT